MAAKKVKNATELRANLFETLEDASEGSTIIIKHRRGSDVVLLSQEKLYEIMEHGEVLAKIKEGLDSQERISHSDAKKQIRKLQSKWQK